MSRLKKSSPAEQTPRRSKPTLICSGYLCTKAIRCRRFKEAQKFHKWLVLNPGAAPKNVIFQSSTINDNGKCVYFIEDLSGFSCNG